MTDEITTWEDHRLALVQAELWSGATGCAGRSAAEREALICEAWGLLEEEAAGSGACTFAAPECGEPMVIRRYSRQPPLGWCLACAAFLTSVTPILDVRPGRK